MGRFADFFASDEDHEPDYSDEPYAKEQRQESRESMRLPGVCETRDPPRHIPCTIVDLSSSGAQIEFASTDQIPASFKVNVEALNMILDCRVVWRKQTRLGVEQTARSAGYE